MGKDQSGNKELKGKMVDSAIAMLINLNEMTVDEIPNITVEFAYVLMLENNNLQALFKIIKGNLAYYFAVQKEKLMSLTIGEQQYQETRNYMLNYHLGNQ